ncbi:hypothetical protein GJ699_07130 [Duganella sp. FT80W]|uniref:F5/8 type C domain-containing protein n=1 Tax=Duganella guangzhouensis TaxID=2666084 RepID=A0A6I2KW30_9BURK|nr:discoidin domain-containing protein [Duganella guangzhouensis]MRW89752.1 hypothetical protein [Duganella guangzhouensis]
MIRYFRAMAMALALCCPLAGAADTIQTLATTYQPVLTETVDASGFKHPGVGLTRQVLEDMRTQVLAQKEPWNTYFNQMLLSSAAGRAVTSNQQSASDPSKPSSYAFNSQGIESRFIADALKAYTQAILYYVTGDEVYRANALHIIRIWAQMDPAQYAYYTDAHIHSGIPLNRMVAAAEILRYSSYQTADLAWTDQDTTSFTNNLITPVIETLQHSNAYFMNQHLYPLIGAMSGYIFTGNRVRYNEGVEWFMVNKTAVDQGQNGAIKQLFRLVTKNDVTGEAVTPVVQHVEMGRDQAHGAGDVTNASLLARLLLAQDTKVDPVEGTASTAANAVGPYEFLNDRILDATEYFAHYMLGYETPWVPTAAHTDAAGNPTIIYKQLASAYRGRLTQNTWEPFYYYKYVKGIDIAQRAPNFTRLFADRTLYNWDGVDGGGDFWLFIPPAAEAEGTQYLVKPIVEPVREIEDRFSALDDGALAAQDDTASYVRVTATTAGSKIAVFGYANATRTVAFLVRTNGVAELDVFDDTITLPDTKGQWRYVSYAFNAYQSLGDMLFITVKGPGTTVDLDHINVQAGTVLTPPVFDSGDADVNLYTNAGSTAAVSYSFAATDGSNTGALTYQIDNLPAGASFDSATGAFSWTPSQAGSYSFVVATSDGTTVTARSVKVVVGADRQAAIAAASAAYKPDTIYITSSLSDYQAAYQAAVSAAGSATDAEFYAKLAALGTATANLKELTPLLADGSINYANMFVASTFGTQVPNALDGTPDTFVVYTLAQNLTHTFDFGPSFKVAANAFQLQVRASFPERIGGVAMFGSNDNENWTRLTPGLTVVTEDMQTLPVQDDLQNQRYRFFKMQMLEPSSTFLEVAEFRIYGQRYETVNEISAVTIAADPSLRNRIVPGATVKLSFVSKTPINSVSATIQGLPAAVTSSDNLNWTATAVMNATVTPGTVKFLINYKTAAGVDAEPVLFTTDGTSLLLADLNGYLGDLLNITSLSDSSGRNAADLLVAANLLVDSNLSTFTDFRLNGSGSGGYLTFDFKQGGTVTLSRVEIIPRQDSYYTRIKGTVVQGSNDNSNWTTLTAAAASTLDWQTLTVSGTQPYRYIRIYNSSAWYGNMAELRLYGVAQSANKIATVSLSSAQSIRNRVVAGNTVKLAFVAKEAINNVNVTIQGQAATVSSSDNVNFTAEATLAQGAAAGNVTFAIAYKQQNGSDGVTNSSTTDSTALYVVSEADVIANVPTLTTLIDSTSNRTAATTLAQVNALFDANPATNSDFRIGSSNSGVGSYIVFDFKADKQVNLSSVELLARQDSNYARIKGVVIQGSNDNATWTTLTAAAVSSMDWQTLAISGSTAYRYIRIYNAGTWFGNLAEVRFHGSLHGISENVSASAQMTQQGATLNRATGKYVGGVTITNTGSTALNGTLQLVLNSLTSGVTLDNAGGTLSGAPYVTVASPLAAGATLNVALTFSNPARGLVSYTPALYRTN